MQVASVKVRRGKSSKFNTAAWSNLDDLTHGKTRPHLLKGAFSDRELKSLRHHIENTIFALLNSNGYGSTDARVRVYVDEDRRDEVIDALIAAQVDEGEKLPEFVKRVSSSSRFGLVANNLEQASAELASDFSKALSAFYDANGVPIGGAEQALFCGNYSATAFGIHEGYEHALLCHLGPGVKDFHCWSQSAYTQITGTREPTFSTSRKYRRLLKDSELFVLEPGDVLFLPALVYHVGIQSEYSMSVAIPQYSYPVTRFLANLIIPTLSAASLPFDPEGMSSYIRPNAPGELITKVRTKFVETVEDWRDKSLDRVLSDYWARLASNAFWELPKVVVSNLDSSISLSEIEARNSPGSVGYRLAAPFRIVTGSTAVDAMSSTVLYLKGFRYDTGGEVAELTSLVRKLNCGEKVSASAKFDARLLDAMAMSGGLSITD